MELLLEYFVPWTRFGFKSYGDGKRNTVNQPITDVLKLMSGQ